MNASTEFSVRCRARPGRGPRFALHRLSRGTRLRRTLAATLALLTSACTEENVLQVRVSSVSVAPETVTLVVGDQVALTATVTDDHGVLVAGASPTW